MRKPLGELRAARGIRQCDLAATLGISRGQLSKIEDRKKGISADHLLRAAEILECCPEDLDVIPARPSGGQARAESDLRTLFRATPEREPRPTWTSGRRLKALQKDLPIFMRRFQGKLEAWGPFLDKVPSECRNETMVHLVELNRGIGTTEVSTDYLGFHIWPVCDEAGRPAGHLLRPALITRDFVLVFQVGVMTPSYYRMDGLLLVLEPQRTFINLEIDGRIRDAAADAERARRLGLPTIRIRNDEVMNGPSIADRLRAKGFCLPRDL